MTDDVGPRNKSEGALRATMRLFDTLGGKLLAWRDRLLPKHPVAIDDNLAEREMKRQALSRKNSMFVSNPRGSRTATVLSSDHQHLPTPQRRSLALPHAVADQPA